ncbi:MAG: hypothetical protein ACOYN5_02350 [Bacteroidales bacterium]
MKRLLIFTLILTALLTACEPSQKITGTWVNREKLPDKPYKSIFILTLVSNPKTRLYLENELADLLNSRGIKAVLSVDVFPPNIIADGLITREQMIQAVKNQGCEGVLTIALLDVKTEARYQQTSAYYYPPNYGMYTDFYHYYEFYHPVVYTQGYYITNKTYFIENNFFDVASEQLMYSIQSSAYSPNSLESFYKQYSTMIMYELKKEKLLRKP